MDIEANKAAYYARIVPVIGAGLRERRIGVVGVAAVAGAVERLAGCRALRWAIADDTLLSTAHPLVRNTGAPPGTPAGAALAAGLRAHNTWEDGWEFALHPTLTATTAPALAAAWRADPPDLLLGGGDAATLAALAALAQALARPALLVLHLAGAEPSAACLALLPGDAGQGRDLPDLYTALGNPVLIDPAALSPTPTAWHTWAAVNGLAALLARAILLHGTAHADPALDRLLWHERRTAGILGQSTWTWAIHYVNLAIAGARPGVRDQGSGIGDQGSEARNQPEIEASDPRSLISDPSYATRNTQHSVLGTRYSALVVGCGSLGSLAARALVASGAVNRLVLMDGEQVEAANPVRQWFHTDQIGQAKATALSQNLRSLLSPGEIDVQAEVCAFEDTRAGRTAFRRLLRATHPGVVVLATGTDVDYALARLCRTADIPHVVGRCYPRAQYFEVILVDGRRGPCFGCLRGHLYTGPAPPPTPEEALRYAPTAAPSALQAEPATIVESGRAADLLATLAGVLATPLAARPPWLNTLLAAGQTCLIGANTVTPGDSSSTGTGLAWAYGIPLPGQIVAFGRAQVLGVAATTLCAACGRRLQVRHAL